ncbi:hypothetical protein Asfd1_80 [Aeromonas phage Asfd_1]|nr:hypothetical protein Asfd1_80 [Aeromonas phage Asfd_1]
MVTYSAMGDAMKKYVLQWRDIDGFLHFIPGSVYAPESNGIVLYDQYLDATRAYTSAKENIEVFLKGKRHVKRRLFGTPTVVVEKPPKHMADMHKRMYDTIHIADISVVPKQMR